MSSGIELMLGLRMICNCNNDNNKERGNFNDNMKEREIIMIRRSMFIQDSSKPFALCSIALERLRSTAAEFPVV